MDSGRRIGSTRLSSSPVEHDRCSAWGLGVPRLELAVVEPGHLGITQAFSLPTDPHGQAAQTLGSDLDVEQPLDGLTALLEGLQISPCPFHLSYEPGTVALSPQIEFEVRWEKKFSGRERSSRPDA